MKKIFLEHAIIFAGTIYGPGEVQAPDDTAELLEKRDAELTAAEEAAAAPIAAAEDQQETHRNSETNLAPLDYIREVRKLLETRVVTPEFVIANLGVDIVEAVKRTLQTPAASKKTKPDAAQTVQTETPAAPESGQEATPAPTDAEPSKDVTLSTKVITALKTAGHDPLDNPEGLAELSDEQLLAIDGIGPASLPAIRAYLAAVLA